MNEFRHIDPSELEGSAFDRIGKQWMLISAQKDNQVNMMTASWGGLGIMWNKKVAFVFIRPQRYTYEFVENGDIITVSFFKEEYRSMLRMMGSKSGRDIDKVKESGLTLDFVSEHAPYFKEAEAVLTLRKLYSDELRKDCFYDKELLSFYEANDYHKMYICEITDAMIR